MTAPDPRVGEIEAREALVHVKCADCAKCRVAEEECWCPECEYWGCERGPDCEDDPNPTTVAYLLAELRKAHEALARVEGVAGRLEARAALNARVSGTGIYDDAMQLAADAASSIAIITATDLRAAVAAANGDGNG